MPDEATERSEQSRGTDRYAQWLEGVPTWLHYEKAAIDQLSRNEVNRLAREELARRRCDGALEPTGRRVWAWLFVEYTLYRDDEGGEADD